ncbi:AAA-ATPase [Rhodococcus phage NiceHouse]|nr:AAA-ATPase [Rhodococcus phage NiceHouse]
MIADALRDVNHVARRHRSEVKEADEAPKFMGTVTKTMAMVQTGQSLWSIGRSLKNWHEERNSYTITIDSEEYLYNAVQSWLLENLPEKRQSVLAVRSIWDDEADNGTRKIRYSYDGGQEKTFYYKGHRVKFSVQQPRASEDAGHYTVNLAKNLSITTFSEDGQKAVLAKIADIAATMYRSEPTVYVLTWSKSRWTYQTTPLRELESVVLADGQAEQIVKDLENFLDSEKSYVNKGIPWHRGMMFYGPPGSGKTSLCKGIAKKLGINLYFLSLSTVKDDDELFQRISEIPAESILLLEDVDCIQSMTDREAKGVTMTGMLNVLDGVMTPHGLITLLTTNHRDKIDDAILRPGRVDLQMLIGMPDVKQANRLFEVFYEQKPTQDLDPKGRSTAELTEIFKQYMNDPELAEVAVLELEPKID